MCLPSSHSNGRGSGENASMHFSLTVGVATLLMHYDCLVGRRSDKERGVTTEAHSYIDPYLE